MRHLPSTFAFFVLVALASKQGAGAEMALLSSEEQTLQTAGLSTDGPALLEFFRLRARTEPDRDRLAALVKRLGDPAAGVQLRAAAELVAWGPLAIPVLRHIANDLDDLATAARARKCLEIIEGPARAAAAAAAARLVAVRKPAGAADALLAYLPFADSPEVLKEVTEALKAVTFDQRKPNGAVVRALKDAVPLRRALAGVALTRPEHPEQHSAVRQLLKDSKPLVRLRAGLALAEVQDAEAIPVLIALLADLPAEQRKEVEAVLIPLAGDWAPGAVAGDDEVARRIRRDGWAAWWRNTDGPALLAALRKRTLTPSGWEKAQKLIKELGDDDFETRQRAQADLASMSTLVLPLLRGAASLKDPEIARRARNCIAQIEKDKTNALPAAAFRLLLWRKPAGAIEALLAYLPYADNVTAASDARRTLEFLAGQEGEPDAALLKALGDAVPARRVIAAELVVKFGGKAHRGAVRKLLKDKDLKVRMRVAVALANAQEKEAIPVLIDLLAKFPAEQTWQAEEILELLAGDNAPKIEAADTAEARKKCHESWARWWQDHSDKMDLTRLAPDQRCLGRTLVSEYAANRILEVGKDGKARWTIDKLGGPVDAVVLPGNRVLIAEYNARKVSERDLQGKVLWERGGFQGNPVNVQRLPNGNTFVATTLHLTEYDRANKELYAWHLGREILGAYKAGNGYIWCLLGNGSLVEVDPSGKVLNSFPSNRDNSAKCGIDLFPGNGVLISQPNLSRVVELSAAGKTLHQFPAPNVTSATRLPNGNILASSMKDMRAFEIDRKGKIVWEFKDNQGVYVVRRR
jgi:HEAT repeat protein